MTADLMSDQERDTDVAILGPLLDRADSRWPWSVQEVVREIGDDVTAVDGLDRLYGAGLIHRTDGYVWPTRAAQRADELRP